MSAVFADSFYFIARINRRDPDHERVLTYSQQLSGRLVTTEWVLMEVADALAGSHTRARVRQFITFLRQWRECEIIAASRGLLDRALELYDLRRDKQWTLTDCTSFIAMRDKGLTEALTYDHHFVQAGFVAVFRQ